MSQEVRDTWYSTRFRGEGVFSRQTAGPLAKELTAVAEAAIVHYQGVSKAYSSAPNGDYRRGHAYAVHFCGVTPGGALEYKVLRKMKTSWKYLATVHIKERFSLDPEEEWIKADAIIFDEQEMSAPVFPCFTGKRSA